MLRSTKFLATALVTLVACTDASDPDADPTGGKADGQTTTLRFSADWSERADGPLVAGQPVRVEYDLDRLTGCRGSTNGSDVWGITGYASFDGGEPKTFALTQIVNGKTVRATPELDVPARATHVDLWFTNTNRWGCIAYDSNENANYGFDIEQRAGVAYATFGADGSEDLPSAVHAGDRLLVHYEPERLATCAASSGGYPQWGVTLNYQVDGGAVKQLLVTRADGSNLVPSDPEITLPRGRDLAVWFEATNRYGCHAYDSNNSANYHIAIE